jgi:hypothetical protein
MVLWCLPTRRTNAPPTLAAGRDFKRTRWGGLTVEVEFYIAHALCQEQYYGVSSDTKAPYPEAK